MSTISFYISFNFCKKKMCISEGIAKGMQGVIFGSGVPQYAIVGTIYTRLYRLRMLEISNFGRY